MDSSEYISGGIRVVKASRESCPVCGHPTGDCVGDGPPLSKIIGYGTIPSMEDDQDFLVEEDLIVERQITPFTKGNVLLARKGQRISLALARELGLF
jgi:hypothetical protein